MSLSPAVSPSASILVVDDDRRVVELLSIALSAYGYRVLQAGDGDEALRVALRERPDLVVLDVRLPRRSGFDVCERLRQDPEDPNVPIIMVSAAAETESRLQGLARGADDYVSKPFSPKELIARIRRLLARVAESREARRRGLEAEQELHHAREEARRSHAEWRGEQKLRELTHAFVHDFHDLLDIDRLAGHLLQAAQSHLGVGAVALLCAPRPDAPLRVLAARGERADLLGNVEIRPEGEMVRLLAGLGRPVRLRELERFLELRDEISPLVAAGFMVLAPLRGPDGVKGVIAAAERTDGRDLGRDELGVLAVLAETAGLALDSAQRCRAQAEGLLEALEAVAMRDRSADERAAGDEAIRWIAPAARMALAPREHTLVVRAVRLGRWARTPEGRRALHLAATRDASGWCAEFLRLIDAASQGTALWNDAESPEERRAGGLLAAAFAYAEARARALDPARAADHARTQASALLDPPTREALAIPPAAEEADRGSAAG